MAGAEELEGRDTREGVGAGFEERAGVLVLDRLGDADVDAADGFDVLGDAVGAVAGGLVRDGRNGMVVPAGDADALGARIRLLVRNPELRARFGEYAREDVAAYTPEAWAEGVSRALAATDASRLLR